METALNSRLNPEFWLGKRVFLTGHTGFKGAWLAFWLHELGAKVFGYALPPNTSPALYDLLGIDDLITSFIGDICDRAAFKEAFKVADPDIIIHMAAQPIVSIGYEDPVGTFDTNIMGVVNLLEMCREHARNTPILVISSDKCYRNDDLGRPFEIHDPLGGHDPYSASKAGTEIIVGAYQASFFANISGPVLASARAGNVIGGGDWSENRLLPDAARAFSSGRPLVIRNPASTRPWQHVVEPLYGYMVLIQAISKDRSFCGPWNFGPIDRNNQSVALVSDIFAKEWGGSASVSIATNSQSWKEAVTLDLNCFETIKRLDWAPVLDLPTTLSWTANWYRSAYANLSRSNIRALCHNQINSYAELQNMRS